MNPETNRIEYKQTLTDSLEKEAVAFLNYPEGGVIYLGISKEGLAIGLHDADALQLKIKDRFKHNIQPSCLGLFDVIHEIRGQKSILKIIVAGGLEKPYYLKKYGMTEKGCFMRIGSSSEPMPVSMIEQLFSGRIRNSIGNMRSPRQDLTFEQLKIYYQENKLTINKNFLKNLELYTPENVFNYAAYLLADENGNSIKIAKYAGANRVDMVENKEYGYCSLIRAAQLVLDKLVIENSLYTKITYPKRMERYKINPVALREAVINAIIHNDYSYAAPPKFEFFSNRLEITSIGGLPQGVSQADFFSGLSVPRNKEIMRVFRDLEIVEQMGSGIPRILLEYDRSIFTLSNNYIRVTFYYQNDFIQAQSVKEYPGLTVETTVETTVKKTPALILLHLSRNPYLSLRDISRITGKSIRAVEKAAAKLVEQGRLVHRGPKKGGYWEVIEGQ